MKNETEQELSDRLRAQGWTEGDIKWALVGRRRKTAAAVQNHRAPLPPEANVVTALVDKARSLGLGKKAPAAAPAGSITNLSPDRPAPGLDQLERFRRAVGAAQ